MTDGTDIKAWHRVADAGFGDIIMQHGFRKVGKSMWRRDGDRVQWRVALSKGYPNDPNSFRVAYGGKVDGLAELVRSYDPKRTFERLPGTSVRRDAGGDLDADLLHEQIEAWKTNHPYEKKRGWRRLMQVMFEPPEEKFDMSYVSVPFCDVDRYASTYRAFDTTRGDIVDIAETLGRAWVRLCLPRIEARLDYPDLYAEHWGPNSNNLTRYSNEDPVFYAAAKLANDQDWIDTMAEQVFAEARKTYAQTREEEMAKGPRTRHGSRMSDAECEALFRTRFHVKLAGAMTVICIAQALNLSIPKHCVDFSKAQRPILPSRRG